MPPLSVAPPPSAGQISRNTQKEMNSFRMKYCPTVDFQIFQIAPLCWTVQGFESHQHETLLLSRHPTGQGAFRSCCHFACATQVKALY